jgi:hypothetical protein
MDFFALLATTALKQRALLTAACVAPIMTLPDDQITSRAQNPSIPSRENIPLRVSPKSDL